MWSVLFDETWNPDPFAESTWIGLRSETENSQSGFKFNQVPFFASGSTVDYRMRAELGSAYSLGANFWMLVLGFIIKMVQKIIPTNRNVR